MPPISLTASKKWNGYLCWIVVLTVIAAAIPATSAADEFPILLYHRFDTEASDGMTVKTGTFETQLRDLERRGYQVIPLRRFVDHLVAHGPSLPPHTVAITVDDGHRSVYTEMLPIVLRHRIPVTLFIYPSAISNAPYALTWQQLDELRATGLFDIQSHTYWHPNFMREKRNMDAAAYGQFVDMQLQRSRQVLKSHMSGQVDMLAWPFGLHDRELEEHARKAGYVVAFTMDRKSADSNVDPMAIPRYLITNAVQGRAFAAILETAGGVSK